jgi:tyrosyl-tRNA synthetase
MSKSLNNAIGINEPSAEMYGKLMSISDELMGKYWLFLTDLRKSEVDALLAEIAAGKLHPMEAKKRLARTITASFHGDAAAATAGENWARMFQQKEFSDNVEEVRLRLADYVPAGQFEMAEMHEELRPTDFSGPGGAFTLLKVAKLLTDCGLVVSISEAQRKLKVGAVRIDGEVWSNATMPLEPHHFASASPGNHRNEVRLQIRLGKKARLVVLS